MKKLAGMRGQYGFSATILLLLATILIPQGDAIAAGDLQLTGKVRRGELELAVGKSQVVSSRSALGQVIVGDPAVADVTLLSSRQLLVLAKEAGRTNLVVRDSQGRLMALMDVVVGFDITGIKRKLYQVLPNEKDIRVRGSNTAVMLSGEVSNALAMETALAVARSFAPKDVVNLLQVGGGQQVLLEARIAEVSRNSLKELGVESNFGDPSLVEFGTALGTGVVPDGSNFTTGAGSGSVLSDAFGAIAFLDTKFFFRLSALERQGLAKTLAEPNVVALSGQEASFLVGGEFPVPVAQTGVLAGALTVEFKEFGVGLKFTPTVLSSRNINLKLNAEVSAIDSAVSSTVSGITIPGITTRRAGTTIEMADGQSFAIAGLLQNDITNAVDQFPGLGDVPVLGALFRSTDFKRKETELVIVVTAHLVKPARGGSLALPTDGFIPPTDVDQYLLGELEGRPAPAASMEMGPAGGSGTGGAAGGMEGQFGHQLQ
jgi:pilus assembly protein CpaC